MADKPWSDGTFFSDGTGWDDPFENFEQTEEYAILRNSEKQMLFGVEIDAYSPQSATLITPASGTTQAARYRFGSRNFVGSTPIKYFVEGRIMSSFSIRRTIPFRDGHWGGLVQLELGSLELSNSDAALDDLADTAVDGRRVAVHFQVAKHDPFGNTILPDFDDFIRIYTTDAEGWTFTEDELRIKLKDPNAVLQTPIEPPTEALATTLQSAVYLGTGQAEGHPELKDVRKPINFGESKFVPPVLVDPFNLVYQVSTRPVAALDIFDGGVRIITTRRSYGGGLFVLPDLPRPVLARSYKELEEADLAPGGAAIWLQGGFFRLATRPLYVVTAHCFERNPDAGGLFTTVGEIIEAIFQTMGVFNYDAASLQVEPYTRRGGFYLESGSAATAAEVIDDLAWSVGGVFGTSRVGNFVSFPIRDPDATEPVLSFDEGELIELERINLPYGIPPHQWRVHYDRIWRPHNASEVTGFSEGYEDQLASAVGATPNDLVEISLPVAEWRGTVARESPNLKAIHPTSAQKETYSYVRNADDAAQLGESYLTLYTPGRKLFRIVVKTALFLLEPGMVVEINAPRWGLQNGMRGVILELEDDVGQGQTEIVLFGGTSTIPFAAPDNLVLPIIGGVPQVGSILQSSVGTWWGHPLPGYSFQWLRDGNAIEGAADQAYHLIDSDADSIVTCRVTATNSEGSGQATATGVGVVAIRAPVNTVLPAVSGEPRVGGVLTASTGSWTATPNPVFSFQWLRNGAEIPDATFSVYVPISADIDTEIACRVTARNLAGTGQATSAPVMITAAESAPFNLELPLISGTAEVGERLTCSDGVWAGNPDPSFTYQWLRGGAAISGATSSTYVPVGADSGVNVSCRVTATNTVGTAQASATAVLIGTSETIPVNTSPPAITGTAQEGSTLTCSTGDWTGSPTFTRQWLRNGVTIAGATAATYVPVGVDVGTTISCRVTARNSAGSAVATAAGVTISAGTSAPRNISLPVISGTPQVGQALTCSTGGWTGTPSPSFARQWLRSGSAISGATGTNYTLVAADEGRNVACRVTATNSAGSASATAAAVLVAPAPTDFPRVLAFRAQQFSQLTNNHQVTMPTSVSAGELLMIFFVHNAGGDAQVIHEPGDWQDKGWTAKYLNRREGPASTHLLVKVAVGNEDSTTVNIRTDRQRSGAAQVFRIDRWFGTVGAVDTGPPGRGVNDWTPLVPPLTTGWGSDKNLWLAVCACADDDAIATQYPASMTDGRSTRSGAVALVGSDTGCSIMVARRNFEAATFAPSNFALDKPEYWVTHLMAIRPAS